MTRGKRDGGLLIGMTFYIKLKILRSLLKRLSVLSISLQTLSMFSLRLFYVLTFTVTFLRCLKGRNKKECSQELKCLSHYKILLTEIGNNNYNRSNYFILSTCLI